MQLLLNEPDALAVVRAQSLEGLGGVFEHGPAVFIRGDGKGVALLQELRRVHLTPAVAAADHIRLGGGILHGTPCSKNRYQQHHNGGHKGPFPMLFQCFHG